MDSLLHHKVILNLVQNPPLGVFKQRACRSVWRPAGFQHLFLIEKPFLGRQNTEGLYSFFFLINFEYTQNLSKRKVVMKNVITSRLSGFAQALFKSSFNKQGHAELDSASTYCVVGVQALR